MRNILCLRILCQHRGKTQFCLMHMVNYLYILERGVALRQILVEYHNLLVQLLKKKKSSSVLKMFCVRDMTDDWRNDWLIKTSTFHFLWLMWFIVPRPFCRSAKIIPVWTFLSICLKIKSISCARQESVEKFAQKPD